MFQNLASLGATRISVLDRDGGMNFYPPDVSSYSLLAGKDPDTVQFEIHFPHGFIRFSPGYMAVIGTIPAIARQAFSLAVNTLNLG